jgi:hypothetical protein
MILPVSNHRIFQLPLLLRGLFIYGSFEKSVGKKGKETG